MSEQNQPSWMAKLALLLGILNTVGILLGVYVTWYVHQENKVWREEQEQKNVAWLQYQHDRREGNDEIAVFHNASAIHPISVDQIRFYPYDLDFASMDEESKAKAKRLVEKFEPASGSSGFLRLAIGSPEVDISGRYELPLIYVDPENSGVALSGSVVISYNDTGTVLSTRKIRVVSSLDDENVPWDIEELPEKPLVVVE